MATHVGLERHLLRRGVAFVIDVLLVWLVVGVIGWLVATNTDLAVKVPNVLETSYTRSVSVAEVVRLDDRFRDLPLVAGESREARFTRTDQWALIPLYTVSLIRERRSGNTTFTRTTTIAADENGQPVLVLDLEPLAWLLLALVSAALLPRGGLTPGKRAAGLRVTRTDAIVPPTFGAALLRETVRLGPFFVSALVTTLAWYGIDLLGPLGDGFGTILGTSFLTLLLFVPLIWSFVRWSGQAIHDRAAGLAVRE